MCTIYNGFRLFLKLSVIYPLLTEMNRLLRAQEFIVNNFYITRYQEISIYVGTLNTRALSNGLNQVIITKFLNPGKIILEFPELLSLFHKYNNV